MKRITQRPLPVLLAILLISILFVLQIADNAQLETDLDEYMPSEHPAFVASDAASEEFGITDSIMIAIEHPESIYNVGTFDKIRELSEQLPEVFEELLDEDITSLYHADNITGSEWGLEVGPFFEETPESQEEFDLLREQVASNEMVYGSVVSLDETSTIIVFPLDEEADTKTLEKELTEYISRYEGPENIYVAGRPIVEGALASLGPADMARMFPIVMITMIILLYILLRSIRHTILNMVIVLLGTIAAFGTMAMFKIPVYSVDTMIPVMLIAIGVAYGIHMHNTIMYLVRKNSLITKDQLINETLSQMTRPVVMAAITTAIGFSALMTSQVLPVRYFGLFSSIGVLSEMLFALLLFPLSIRLLGVPKTGRKREDEDLELPVQGKIKDHRWTVYIMNKGKLITLIAVIVAVLGGVGATKIWIDTSFLANFEEDHPISVTDRFVNETFAGTSSINIILSGEQPDTFKTPEALSLMAEMQDAFVEDPMIGGAFSLTDFIKRMNFVLNEEQDEYFSIPDNQELIAQYLLLYDMSGDPETIAKVVDYDYQKTNMTLQLKSDSSSLIEKIIAQVATYEEDFGDLGITITYAGSGYTSFIFADLLMEGQVLSLGISFLIVAVLLTLVFKSMFIGIAGTTPIAITATVNFGVMGLLGIPLSSATALISSIAIGIGVDYAIHLIEHYMNRRNEGFSISETVNETISHTGKAIIFNAIAVMGGFIVLTFSVFPPNRQVGSLIALNMVLSALGTLSVLLVTLVHLDKKHRLPIKTAAANKE
ncbi:MAG: RND family transporter [Sphaerochaetaceae bacterium]|nr:RND family transporter [Sphaerochaetaceae bacterium]